MIMNGVETISESNEEKTDKTIHKLFQRTFPVTETVLELSSSVRLEDASLLPSSVMEPMIARKLVERWIEMME